MKHFLNINAEAGYLTKIKYCDYLKNRGGSRERVGCHCLKILLPRSTPMPPDDTRGRSTEMKIFQSNKFERSLKKLPRHTIEKAIERIFLFEQNPFDRRLDTHKLHGKLKNLWSFSVIDRIRVLFEFDKSDVILLDIGDHDLYR